MPTAAGLVTVATYASEEQAEEALEVLENAGIRAVLLDDDLEEIGRAHV